MQIPMIWGRRILRERERLGWTQAELAAKVGVSGPAIAYWEAGVRTPRVNMWPLIAGALGVEVDVLFSTKPDAEAVA